MTDTPSAKPYPVACAATRGDGHGAGEARTVMFLEQYYYPEGWGGAQLPRDVTMDWSQAGYRVVVVCGSEQYAQSEDRDIVEPRRFGVRIRRIPALIGGDIRSRKVLRQLWFLCAAFPIMALGRRPCLFVTQTNPPVTVLLTAVVAMLVRRPYVIIAQDLYPEVILAHGMVRRNTLFARLLQGLFDCAYARASAVVSLGARMSGKLRSKGVNASRIWEISNWATGALDVVRGEENELRKAWDLDGKFVLVYSGNLGLAHDCETLIRAVALAKRAAPQLKLVFIGDGSRSSVARSLVREMELEDAVTFKPFVPFEMLPQTFGLADLSVVTLLPGFDGLVVPSKFFGNMARGVPTLYIGPEGSDVDIVLNRSGGGFSIRNGDLETAVHCILAAIRDSSDLARRGANAQRFYEAHLSRAAALSKYRQLVEHCLSSNHSKGA